jgi:hypothetical protein
LRVVNRTRSSLVCRTWALSHDGEAVLAHPVLVEVRPLSTQTALLPLWPGDFASFDRAAVEVVGAGVHCIVEAPAPERKSLVRTHGPVVGVALALGLVALLSAAAMREAMPRITAFAAPPEMLAGTTIQAQYEAAGAGRLSYVVLSPDGSRLSGGPLADRSGSIPIAIPASTAAGAYTLQLNMTGFLGTSSQTRILNAILPTAGGARIDDISVRPAVAAPGQTIDVSYSASADGGYVRLLDDAGTIWDEKPFAGDGEAKLTVPPLREAGEMRVLLHVTKAGSVAQSMAGIVVAGAGQPAAADASQIAGDDESGMPAATGSDANGTFEVLDKTVKGGQPIRVHVLSPRNGMHIALTDGQSHEVSAVDVGAQADVVTLQTPKVLAPTSYTVVASFTDGFGQESVIQPVTILP